jgi:hypothetical protein
MDSLANKIKSLKLHSGENQILEALNEVQALKKSLDQNKSKEELMILLKKWTRKILYLTIKHPKMTQTFPMKLPKLPAKILENLNSQSHRQMETAEIEKILDSDNDLEMFNAIMSARVINKDNKQLYDLLGLIAVPFLDIKMGGYTSLIDIVSTVEGLEINFLLSIALYAIEYSLQWLMWLLIPKSTYIAIRNIFSDLSPAEPLARLWLSTSGWVDHFSQTEYNAVPIEKPELLNMSIEYAGDKLNNAQTKFNSYLANKRRGGGADKIIAGALALSQMQNVMVSCIVGIIVGLLLLILPISLAGTTWWAILLAVIGGSIFAYAGGVFIYYAV